MIFNLKQRILSVIGWKKMYWQVHNLNSKFITKTCNILSNPLLHESKIVENDAGLSQVYVEPNSALILQLQ